MVNKIKVVQDPQKFIKREILAESIIKISNALTALRASGINEKGIIVLLSHQTSLSITTCRVVLDGLAQLAKTYTK